MIKGCARRVLSLFFKSGKKISILFPLILAFALGLLAGLLIHFRLGDEKHSSAFEIRQGGYRFTNPLLDCEVPGDPLIIEILGTRY